MPMVWAIYSDILVKIVELYEVEIIAFVLMSNHFHLLISTPWSNLSEAMEYLMRETSKQINAHAGRINHTYGTRYHATLLSDDCAFSNAYKYLYRNPADAGMCAKVEDYEFSTIGKYFGRFYPFLIPEHEKRFAGALPHAGRERLAWLNVPHTKKQKELLQRALRHAEFKFTTRRNDRHTVAELQRIKR